MNELQVIHKTKIKIISIVFLISFIASILLLMKWQIFDNQEYLAIANERYLDVKIPSVRGSILAKDGSTLAFSEPRFDVYVWVPELDSAEKNNVQTRNEFLEKVAPVINLTKDYLSSLIRSGPQWLKIASKATLDQRNQLLQLKTDANPEIFLQGMQFQYVNKRIYPEDQLACQAIGFVGLNNRSEELGVGGIEQYYDGSLKPREGYDSSEVDSFGNLIALSDNKPIDPKPGVTLFTTIDKTLQLKLEARLKAGLEEYKADSLTGIIMDPKTGAILAMANYPNFDPNNYNQVTDTSVLGNKAINTPYEIGSVAKIFTLSAALDLNKVQANTVLLPNGHNGCEVINPNPPKNVICTKAKKSSENDCICTYDGRPVRSTITVQSALIGSDNIGFRHIALTMTDQEFYNYLKKFGLGNITGIDVAGESVADLKNYQSWNYADQAVYSYGHGYEVTPLQAITGIAAVANGGKRVQPYIVSKVLDADGNVKEFQPKVVEQVITPITSDTMSNLMHEVYLNQLIEKRFKDLKKYYIALKSGTALIPYHDRPGYSSDFNATFVGFDASPEHKFIMLIKIERPKVGNLSYYNARPLWLDIFNDIKDYLGVSAYTTK